MRFIVELSESGTYVRVTVTEAMTVDLAAKVGLEATALGESAGVARYLYDLREARNVETALTNYQFAHEQLPRLEVDRRARVAMLVSVGDRSHDFIENAVRNAGFNVKKFEDEAAAIAWLERVA